MSVKDGLLALLSTEPMGAAQLRREFEARTGGSWPLNIGQVYTTLQRLERDGLVASQPAPDDAATELYSLTAAGRDQTTTWWSTPVARGRPERDELVIKLALAATMPEVDIAALVQRQRAESMRALRDYTRLKIQAEDDDDLAWMLVLENLIFSAEAEVRWLDHIETAVDRVHQRTASGSAGLADPANRADRSSLTKADSRSTTADSSAASTPEPRPSSL